MILTHKMKLIQLLLRNSFKPTHYLSTHFFLNLFHAIDTVEMGRAEATASVKNLLVISSTSMHPALITVCISVTVQQNAPFPSFVAKSNHMNIR